jgi:hypothetical protein
MNVSVGGSYYYNDRTAEVFQAWGPFAGLRFGRLTWLGEFDWTRSDPTAAPRVTAFTTANEVSFEVVQGVDVYGAYDFHDPDVDVQSGSVQRVGGGLDALPYPFLAVRAAGHWYVVDEPSQGASGLPLDLADEFREGHVQIQFLY